MNKDSKLESLTKEQLLKKLKIANKKNNQLTIQLNLALTTVAELSLKLEKNSEVTKSVLNILNKCDSILSKCGY